MKKRWIWSAETRRTVLQEIMRLPERTVIEAVYQQRTNVQNKMIYGILRAFSTQRPWIVNGKERYLLPEEWKDILTAAYYRELAQLAQSLDGQALILVGRSTSAMTKKECADFIDFLQATARDMNINLEHIDE